MTKAASKETPSARNADFDFLIEKTRNCRLSAGEVADLAEKTRDIEVEVWEQAVVHLMDEAEDKQLGVLLSACSVNGIALGPELLAETLKVVEPIVVYGSLFNCQDASAIEPLLRISKSEELTEQRKVIAVFTAAELAVRHDSDPEPVLKAVRYHEVCGYRCDFMMLYEAEMILKHKTPPFDLDRFLIEKDVLEILSEIKPESVISTGQTIRRPVPKVGRNEPCPCGSGKKYKKCCIDKDQEQLRDASNYQGLTRTQVLRSPELAPDNEIFMEMRAYHIRKIDAKQLRTDQLILAYKRATVFGLVRKGYEFLLERERRTDGDWFDRGHFGDLFYEAIIAGDVELAEKIIANAQEEDVYEPEVAALLLDMLKNREIFDRLDAAIGEAMGEDTEMSDTELLYRLVFDFTKIWPALSIVFSRAVLIGEPDRAFDNEMLIEELRKVRADIGLDPYGDDLEDFYDWYLERAQDIEDDEMKSERIRQLEKQIEKEKREAGFKEKILKKKQMQLEELTEELNKKLAEKKNESAAKTARTANTGKQERAKATAPAPASGANGSRSDADQDLVRRLKDRVVSLKEEIRNQQDMRRQLRLELESEQKIAKKRIEETRTEDAEESAALCPVADLDEDLKTVLVPEYAQAFRRSLESLPPAIGAKALKAVAGFAARDKSVLDKTRPLKVLPGYYRIRIGIDYRLMLKWLPDKQLEALDLIPRSRLETWIRGMAGKA